MKLKDYHKYLKPRKRDAHKGDFGRLLVIGGDVGLMGAPRIAAMGAARVGAGLVTCATRDEHDEFMSVEYPEIMNLGIISTEELSAQIQRSTAVVIGPGLGKSPWSAAKYNTVMVTTKPMVLDADGLNQLAQAPQHRDHWVLTPHPGEAARLLETDTEVVQRDRIAAAKKLQEKYGGVIVLKGADTLVVNQQGDVKKCVHGNPGMASGGMGDLLAGMVGGLISQGMPLDIAAECGVCLHAAAGDMSAKRGGERGMLATDLLPFVRKLVNP
jgi:ADP-dependent NAD(P)H-hydrate dehydratase / NAD(P)H-hydrate epimerase